MNPPELVVLTGHAGRVLSIAFSPDGKLLATAGSDGKTLLWETQSGAVLRVWDQERDFPAPKVAFTPDGGQVITSRSGSTFWNVLTGHWEGTIPRLRGPLMFSPDGRVLYGYAFESFLAVEPASGCIIRYYPFGVDLGRFPRSVAISADASTCAAGALHDTPAGIPIWDLPSGELRYVCSIPATLDWIDIHPKSGEPRTTAVVLGQPEHLALSPDGEHLAVSEYSSLWVCSTRDDRAAQLLHACGAFTTSVAFSPSGASLAAGFSDGSVKVWELPSGELKFSSRGHSKSVYPLAFSPDGKLLATGSDDKGVRLWHLETGRRYRHPFLSATFEASGVVYSPDGSSIAVSYTDGTLRVWNAKTGALEHWIETQSRDTGPPNFSPDGALLFVGFDPRGPAWSTTTGERLLPPPPRAKPPLEWKPPPTERVSPDGKLLARATAPEWTIELLERETGRVVQTFVDPEGSDYIMALAISPDGRRLACGDLGFSARVWDVESGELVYRIVPDGDSNSYLAFSPDGGVLAIGGDYDFDVILCDLHAAPGPRIAIQTPHEPADQEVWLKGHTYNIRGVSFSPDGRTVATVAADAALKVWEAETGRLLATFLALPSPNGRSSEQWITFTPEGYYHCSPGATPYLRWRVGDDLQPAATYAGTFHSPIRVEDSLR